MTGKRNEKNGALTCARGLGTDITSGGKREGNKKGVGGLRLG